MRVTRNACSLAISRAFCARSLNRSSANAHHQYLQFNQWNVASWRNFFVLFVFVIWRQYGGKVHQAEDKRRENDKEIREKCLLMNQLHEAWSHQRWNPYLDSTIQLSKNKEKTFEEIARHKTKKQHEINNGQIEPIYNFSQRCFFSVVRLFLMMCVDDVLTLTSCCNERRT